MGAFANGPKISNRKSWLKWNSGVFDAVKMIGNQWRTIGVSAGQISQINCEEAVFLVSSKQAVYQLQEDDGFREDVGELVRFLVPVYISPNFLRVYLSLKRLGYIIWRRDNDYLKSCPEFHEINHEADFYVFKPNSQFKKTNPFGLMFTLKLTPISQLVAAMLTSTRLDSKLSQAFAFYDETGQIYLTLGNANDRFK